jgi:esterase/lipase superfamily enzyme
LQIITNGCSTGVFHAAQFFLRHPGGLPGKRCQP